MAVEYKVAGPVTVSMAIGTGNVAALGRTPGDALIVIQEVQPKKPVIDDLAGGEPVDFIQLQRHALVSIALGAWEASLLDSVMSAMSASSTAASAARVARGESGPSGMLDIADGGFCKLQIAGTKKTARKGYQTIVFPRAVIEPGGGPEIRNIGVAQMVVVSNWYCFPDGSNNIYTVASIT